MLVKFLKAFSILPIVLVNIKYANQQTKIASIAIKGHSEIAYIGEKIPINLFMVDGHPYIRLNISIYVNGTLELFTQVISKYLSDQKYYINGFNDYNETKEIKIVVNYEDQLADDSVCNFTLSSPAKKSFTSNFMDTFNPYTEFITHVDFSMQGLNNQEIIYHNESGTLHGISNVNLDKTRYLDLSKYYLDAKINVPFELDCCELRLYTKFNKSDLTYNGTYTSIDINVKKIGTKFHCLNEYKFYVDKFDGMIYKNFNESCEEDTLPFFIPYSVGYNTSIYFDLVFDNIGYHQLTYTFKGVIHLGNNPVNQQVFGSVINYKYQLISIPLMGVNYE